MNRSPWRALALLALLSGCRAGSTGADTRHYPCNQQAECARGFVCTMGTCAVPVPEGDGAGVPDAGDGTDVPDAGDSDGGDEPVPTKLSFVTAAQSLTAGQCSRAATVEAQTASGSTVLLRTRWMVALSAPSSTGFTFYQDAACTNAITSTRMEAGSSQATFYFRGTTAQPVNVTATVTKALLAQQSETVRAGAPSSLAFTTSAQTLDVGACSDKVEVELRDAYANPTSFPAQTSLTPLGTDLYFYSDAACTTALTDTSFAAGAARTSFYFRSRPSGSVRVTASVSGLNPMAQDQSVQPLQSTVRTGSCEISVGSTSATCPISPAQGDMAKTMLFFQASAPSVDSPDAANTRCGLSSTSAITCSRNNGNNTPKVVISWQTVEMATGLRVQHLQPTCASSATTLTVPISPVSMGNTFLLVSSETDGPTLDADDFFTATLSSAAQVKLQFDTACSTAWKGSLQVVEMAGARVTRGGSVSLPNGSYSVSSPLPSTVDLGTSALLFTYRLTTPGTAEKLCDRVLRGELSSATSVGFFRGAGSIVQPCSAANIDAIAWERIDFGPVARVQPVTFGFSSGDSTADATLTSVDASRTVVFSNAQALNGQSGGESAYAADDLSAEALVSFGFTTPTTLTARRSSTNGRAKMTAYVVQFEP